MCEHRLVAFDMDGVIFEHHNFWLELHKALGTYEEGLALTRKYLKTDYERLVREVPGRLWKGKEAKPYLDLIRSTRYKPHAQETLIALKERGYHLAIISSGPLRLARRAKEECGVQEVVACELVIDREGRFTGEFCYAREDKAATLKRLAQAAGSTLRETVFVGHSHNDIGALRAAGLGVAYLPDEDAAHAADRTISDLSELPAILEP